MTFYRRSPPPPSKRKNRGWRQLFAIKSRIFVRLIKQNFWEDFGTKWNYQNIAVDFRPNKFTHFRAGLYFFFQNMILVQNGTNESMNSNDFGGFIGCWKHFFMYFSIIWSRERKKKFFFLLVKLNEKLVFCLFISRNSGEKKSFASLYPERKDFRKLFYCNFYATIGAQNFPQ